MIFSKFRSLSDAWKSALCTLTGCIDFQLEANSMRVNVLSLSLCLVIAAGSQSFAAGKALPVAVSQRVAGGVPNFDIRSICGKVTGGVETPSGCATDEQSAREQLNKVWAQYASTERSRCAELSSLSGLPSYVELLTCLEVADDAKGLSNE
jgi:hypothetical protein